MLMINVKECVREREECKKKFAWKVKEIKNKKTLRRVEWKTKIKRWKGKKVER